MLYGHKCAGSESTGFVPLPGDVEQCNTPKILLKEKTLQVQGATVKQVYRYDLTVDATEMGSRISALLTFSQPVTTSSVLISSQVTLQKSNSTLN